MIVIAGWFGGLGNRLQTFAHIIAASIDQGEQVLNPCLGSSYASFFPALSGDPLCRFPPRGVRAPGTSALRRVAGSLAGRTAAQLGAGWTLPGVGVIELGWRRTCDLTSPGFVNLVERKRVVLLSGYRFIHPDVWSYRHRIRQFFAPSEEHRREAARVAERARRDSDVLLGVHIRRNDYRQWRGGAYYFDDETYADLIHRAMALFSGRSVSFLLCSSEAHERWMPSALSDVRWTPGSGVAPEDLYALAHCDYLVGPPSSFSGWASFYGGLPRLVVYDPQAGIRLEDFVVNTDLAYMPLVSTPPHR